MERISAAVLEALLPFMNETRSGVEAIRRDLEEHKLYVKQTVTQKLSNLEDNMNRIKDELGQRVNSVEDHLVVINKKNLAAQVAVERSLNESMATVNDNIEEYKIRTLLEVADLNISLCGKIDAVRSRIELIDIAMREEFKRKFQEHKNQTTSELSELHTSLQSTQNDHLTQICAKMDVINSRISSVSSAINGTIDSKLDLLDSKQDELDMKVMSINSELGQSKLTNVTKQLKKISESQHESLGPCRGEGWTRVAYLDMTDPNTTCPSGWQLTEHSKRTCGKINTSQLMCDSVFFPVSGEAYNSVCGRVSAYQNGVTDAFEAYDDGRVATIDGAYVSGVSLTHGSPRQHIWTFAAGDAENTPTSDNACPCDATISISVPPFVGEDYFCESGANLGRSNAFQSDDPLWDGTGCTSTSTCCSFNNPPYFTKRLPNPTTDDLEMRLCWWERAEETPIEFIGLYVGFDKLSMREIKENVLNNITRELQKISNSLHEDLAVHEHNVLTNVTKQHKHLAEKDNTVMENLHNFVDYNDGLHVCGGTGGWRRAVFLDMTDPNTNCPSGWRLNTMHSKRTCDTGYGGYLTCDSVLFPVSGGAYNRVCGTVRGYKLHLTGAFSTYRSGQATNIDEPYVSGLSLTHGSPRQHIWTFAAGSLISSHYRPCPCDSSSDIRVPPFVNRDYFCDSGAALGTESSFHPDNPLWDGKNCTRCCTFNNPPYFNKRLSSATTDDIEIRQCQQAINVETPIELIDIYVKLDKVDIAEIENNVLSGVRKELKITQKSFHKQIGHMNVYECGGTGGWRRVVYLDMTDPNANCPSGWQLSDSSHSIRACERVRNNHRHSCDSAFFPVDGRAYSHVCGRIRSYQYDVTTAFQIDHEDNSRVVTIDEAYVSGVSLTHGSPRQHIWTFAAGVAESRYSSHRACPCDATVNITIPSFVGEHYFCESGTNSGTANGYHPDDPLWDGKNCTSTSTCCLFNNPPYFTKQLPNPTTDDLEIRQCQTYIGYVGTPIELIELYVK